MQPTRYLHRHEPRTTSGRTEPPLSLAAQQRRLTEFGGASRASSSGWFLLTLVLAMPGLRAADRTAAAFAPAERLTTHTDPRTGMALFLRNEAVQSATPRRVDPALATLPVTDPADLAAAPWADAVAAAQAFLARHTWAFGESDPAQRLVPHRAERDTLGMTHVRFRQVVPVTLPPGESTEPDRLPVVGGELVVHLTPGGEVSSVGGRLAAGLATVLPAVPAERDAPGLTRETAIALAQGLFQIENGVEGVADATVARAIVVPGLLENTADASAYLTWAVGVATEPWFSAVYYLDAQDGTLRFRGERVLRLNRKIYDCTANPASGGCWSSVVTNGYHHGRREGEASWGPNPFYNAYDVDIGYDVLGAAHAYIAAHYGRNGANGQGGLGSGSSSGQPLDTTAMNTYQDQFWTPGCVDASYNADRGLIGFCHAVTVPDIITHEYSHAITASVRQMTYYGQGGAVDESFSDVFGQIFGKSYTGATDWRNVYRDLRSPSTSAELAEPDRFYSPLVYCQTFDNGGVHANSTILSHSAYLLAEGTGTNGPFNGCTIQAIGIEQMEQVMYRANVFYYSASESFNGAYLDWIQASTDLYGATSETTRQVTRALQAVELDQPGLCSGIAAHPPAAADVPPGPLTVTPAGSDLVLSWPPVPWLAGEPVLLSTTNLTAGPWTALTAPLTTNVVTVPNSGAEQYFRLRIL